MKNVVIDRRAVKAVLQGAAPDRTRYAFNGIQLENGDAHQLVATNGKWLIRNKFPKGIIENVRAAVIDAAIPGFDNEANNKALLSADMLDNTVKACRGVQSAFQDCKLVVDTAGLKVGIRYLPGRDSGPAQMTGDAIEGKFPNFQPLFDRERNGIKWGMAIRILESIVKAAKAVGSENVHFQFPAPNKKGETDEAVHFELDVSEADIGAIDGLVMPITP